MPVTVSQQHPKYSLDLFFIACCIINICYYSIPVTYKYLQVTKTKTAFDNNNKGPYNYTYHYLKVDCNYHCLHAFASVTSSRPAPPAVL